NEGQFDGSQGVRIVAEAEGYAPADVQLVVTDMGIGTPEPQLSGATVYLDANDNQQLDSGELTTIADATGRYEFQLVPAGSYHVRAIGQPSEQPALVTFDELSRWDYVLSGTAQMTADTELGQVLAASGTSGDFVTATGADELSLGTSSVRSVSLWVNPAETTTRQLIYEEGDADQGLNVYIENGDLYIGGWNLNAGQSNWSGNWVHTPISAGAWHHVALTLSGTKFVGPDVLFGYLDGVEFERTSGSQLWNRSDEFAVIGPNSSTRFASGTTVSNSAGEYPLNGQVSRLAVSNEFWSAAQVLAQAMSFAALNSPPTFTLNIIIDTVAEDATWSAGTTLAEIAIVDDNLSPNEISVVALSGADAGQFQVVDAGGTLELQWTGSTLLDHEAQSSYSVTIIVDELGVGAEPDAVQTFVLNVTDVNEPPSVSFSPANDLIDENTETSSAVFIADIMVVDDALGTSTISLSGTDAASFSISGTPQSGYQLLLNAGVTLNATAKPTYDVSVSVDDPSIGATPDDSADFMLTVFGNAAPTIALTQALTDIDEDEPLTPQVKVADIVITDDLAGDNVLSLSGDDAGLFEILGNIPSAALYLRSD
ncbi:MAG: hypothetical protein KDB23_30210, partial [Planctomycetales bacterium]|nr:hypothetical protein [Planctomycetales bacterium]